MKIEGTDLSPIAIKLLRVCKPMLNKEAKAKYGHLKWRQTLHRQADYGNTSVYECEEIEASKSAFCPNINYVKGEPCDPFTKEYGDAEIVYRIGGEKLTEAEFFEKLNSLEVEIKEGSDS